MRVRVGPRVAVVASVLTLVVSVVGFIVTLVLSTFVLDKFDAYGEVPIPGNGRVHLPKGEVTVSFHTVTTGRPTSGFPVPKISMDLKAPDGAPAPAVIESIGGTTTVNSDTHVRVWQAEISESGTYQVSTDGDVDGYIDPRLAFGHGSSYGWLLWVFAGLAAFGVVGLVSSLVWAAHASKAARPLTPDEVRPVDGATLHAVPDARLSDQSIRLEQLKQLAALRDSGALTDEEFEAEKHRILNS